MKDIEQMEVPSLVTTESGLEECLNVPVSHFPYSELLPALPYSCHVFSTSVPKWYTLDALFNTATSISTVVDLGNLLFWRMLPSALRVALFWGQMLYTYMYVMKTTVSSNVLVRLVETGQITTSDVVSFHSGKKHA